MLRFRGIIIVVVCLILSILAISINPIKISDLERGNNDNFLGMVLGLDLRGGTHEKNQQLKMLKVLEK